MNALAYHRQLLPGGIRLRAMFASDIGHWDVPDVREILPEAYGLVDRGLIDTDDFREFAFADPVRLFTAGNPDFFAGTVVEAPAGQVTR